MGALELVFVTLIVELGLLLARVKLSIFFKAHSSKPTLITSCLFGRPSCVNFYLFSLMNLNLFHVHQRKLHLCQSFCLLQVKELLCPSNTL